MVCFAPHVSSALLVREAVAADQEYGCRDGAGEVGDPFGAGPVPDSRTGTGMVLDPGDAGPAPDPGESGPRCDSTGGVAVPDPFDDAEALEELEEEITTLAAHIHAATQRLLSLIAEFDRRRGWELGGHRSCAHWLSFRTGFDLGTAREKVRTARALEGLPRISASMARGGLSFSQVRALSRVATAENEGELVGLAQGCTTAQLERMVRAYRQGGSGEDEAAAEERRYRSRSFSVFPDEDGMYVVRGRLPAEVGAMLMRAVEAASDALYREERERLAERVRQEREKRGLGRESGGPGFSGEGDTEGAAARRRADAVGLLAERAMEVGFGSGRVSGSRGERYQVVLHVEAETLAGEGEGAGAGHSELEDGTRVSAETSRRLSCDAGVVRVKRGVDGTVLDVGRRRRTVGPGLRRALEVRDGGCRFPGCGLRFTEAHHLKHWGEGGETKLENLVLLCRHHHRLVHEGRWRVGWWGPGRVVFFDPRGGTHYDGRFRLRREGRGGVGAPEGPGRGAVGEGEEWMGTPETRGREGERGERGNGKGTELVASLTEANRRRGVEPDGWTAGARWKREDDIPDEIYFRALEALEDPGP